MADIDLMENVGGILCPIDPADALDCTSCQ
jgi:hypothetical protein